MKKLFLYLIPILILFSCKEEPIYIPSVANNGRVVLVEEFTGVRCVNCPDGAKEIETLKSKFGEQLVTVSIHAGIFSKKYPQSKYDLSSAAAKGVLGYLGEPDGYPAVVIDRKPLGLNGTLPVVGQAKWIGLIQEELKEKNKVLVGQTLTYNDATRELKVSVELTPLEALSGEHRLSVMLTETDIVDAQLVPNDGVVTNYTHRHVLRDMFTNYEGNVLTETLSKGNRVVKEFTYTVPTDYNIANCEIIAFVHTGGATKNVLQATAKKIK